MSDPIEQRLARIESSLQDLDTVKVVGHLAHIHQALITMCDTLTLLANPPVMFDANSVRAQDLARNFKDLKPGMLIPMETWPPAMMSIPPQLDDLFRAYVRFRMACSRPEKYRAYIDLLDELSADHTRFCELNPPPPAGGDGVALKSVPHPWAKDAKVCPICDELHTDAHPANPPPPTHADPPPSDPEAPESGANHD